MGSPSLYITDQYPVPSALRAGWPRGLPAPVTRLVGRARELDEIDRLLRRTRLLTLTGAGGSGKTRLAIEAAARVAGRYPEGIGFVELGAITDPRALPHHVAVSLGVGDEPGRSARDALVERYRDRAALVVLDNCEHLLDACAELVDALIRGSAQVTLLATSRQALGVAGETAWLVPPLEVPASDHEAAERLAVSESVQLFVDRATAAQPSFSLAGAGAASVAHICRRLEGIPLAIELAAARVRALTVEQIAARLDEAFLGRLDAFGLLSAGARTAPSRHRTLRGVMDWSYGLLTEPERRLLERLSVFVGGFTLEHAEAICCLEGDDVLRAADVLDLVAALVDKSLVVVGDANGAARYRLLETVRQYARERLRARGETEEDVLRERRARYFVAMAEEAAPRLVGGAGDPPLVARLTLESANFRAVVDWCEREPARTEIALRLGTALHWLWFARGQFREGRQRLGAALERGGGIAPLVRARALTAYGSVLIWQGDYAGAPRHLQEAIAIFRGDRDDAGLAYALADLGAATALGGDPAAAAPILEEAVTLARTLPASTIAAIALYWRGLAAHQRGELELARASFEEALGIGRALGDPASIAHPMYRLGWLECDLRRFAEARALFLESLDRLARMDDRWGTVQVLDGLACVALGGGEPARAARLLAGAESMREGHGIALPAEWRANHERLLAACRAALGDEGVEAARREGRAMTIAEIVAEARLVPAGSGEAAVEPSPPAADGPTPKARGAEDGAALRVLALGPLQVIRDGETLQPDAWGSAKARELLLFLLSHPDGCTREQVGVALWPDASSAKLRNIFHVTLHRLRRALGHAEWIALSGDRYLVDPALSREFDAERFEREARAALREARTSPRALDALRRAVELYRGDFLATELVGDWHLEPRDRLARLCVDALLVLGGALLDAERHGEAADVFRRVLERDPLHEDAWRRLMLCHARIGERPQAIRLYQRLERLLRDELETEPAPETVRLHERLQRGAEV